MAKSKYDINLKYDASEVISQFNKIKKGLRNFKEPLLKAKETVMKETDKQWGSKGINLGTPWRSRKKTYPWPILQKSGAMRGGFDWKPKKPKDYVIVLNKIDYFKYHQLGAPSNNLPQRVMLRMTKRLEKMITEEFKKYINKLTK